MRKKTLLPLAAFLLLLTSCARLHHITVSNVDARMKGSPFEVYVSDMGVNIGETSRAMSRASKDGTFKKIGDIVSMFQMGPRTGNPIYHVNEFMGIGEAIKSKCPSMKVTGLTSIREMRNYNFVSGEIVKITGFCRS